MATAPQPLLLTLKVVAVIALMQGIWSLVHVIDAALHNNVDIDFNVLGILAFIGLFRLSSMWRIYMLVCTWLGLIGVPVLLVARLLGADVNATLLGFALGHVDFTGMLINAFIFMAYFIWQYSVLTDPAVVQLFQQKALSAAEFRERVLREG